MDRWPNKRMDRRLSSFLDGPSPTPPTPPSGASVKCAEKVIIYFSFLLFFTSGGGQYRREAAAKERLNKLKRGTKTGRVEGGRIILALNGGTRQQQERVDR